MDLKNSREKDWKDTRENYSKGTQNKSVINK